MRVCDTTTEMVRWAARRAMVWRARRQQTKPTRPVEGTLPWLRGTVAWIRSPPDAWPLAFEPITLGRAKDNDIVLAHWSVRGYHAIISSEGPPWQHLLEDFSGDTLINGEYHAKLPLRRRDVIQLGLVMLEYSGIADSMIGWRAIPR